MKHVSTIQAPVDLGAAGTETFDISTRHQISAIDIFFKVTNVTVSIMLSWVLACISKIEIIDGSKILTSLTGEQAFGLDYISTGKLPSYKVGLTVGDEFSFGARILFGRYLWDESYALRPEVYSNLQLRITWDEDACNTSAVVNEFAAYAQVDSAPAQGNAAAFLSSKEVKAYNMAASSHNYTELPTDGPIRMLMLNAFSTDHDMSALFNTVKIDVNQGSIILIEQPVEYMLKALTDYGFESFNCTLDAVVTAKDLYSCFGEQNGIKIEYDDTAVITTQSKFAVPSYKGPFIDLAASVDIQADKATVNGLLPGGCLPIFFGAKNEPSTWLKTNPNDTVRADVLSSSDADSGDSAALVVQQEIRP